MSATCLRIAGMLLLFVPALFFPFRSSASQRMEVGSRGRVEVVANAAGIPPARAENGARPRGGLVSGQVQLTGPMPSLKPIRVSKDHGYCGVTLPNRSYLVGRERGLKNVVVYLEGVADTPMSQEGARVHVLENHSCLFAPRIMAMRWGDRLLLKNNDPKLHIIHAYAAKRTVFNVALPFQGNSMSISRKIKTPALLQVNCDTHAWMRAYIYVFGHRYFALTDDNGLFSIEGIPAGRYTLKAWHEEAGVRTAEVVVPEDGKGTVRFEFGSEER